MFTINFNERVWQGLPEGQMFTSDRAELARALEKSVARGRTALFDALTAALTQLEAGHRQKKVLIVVSDGGDNASTSRFEDVLNKALRTDAVIIYTISIRDQYDLEANPDVLRKIAASTGGDAFFLRSAADVSATLERISRDMRSGYTIGYVSSDTGNAGYRSIRVEVRPPDHRKVTVRARSGYMAGAGTQ
jgi:Ca-activated chloride channel family protein